jgi:ABC-type phosphate transport system substrate-binding protein
VRILKKLVTVSVGAVTATALAMAPAMADPVNAHLHRVTPKAFDAVGVGSDTIESVLDQLSVAYNSAHKVHNSTHPWIYSWDATPPSDPLNLTSKIVPKAGCAKILRPDGSSAGISALAATPKDSNKKFNCFDFARSSRGRASTDPAKHKGGILFVALAKDAVTISTNKTSNAPANLTKKQLNEIYNCSVPAVGSHPANNWADLGGSAGTILPVLPQTGSGTRSFFLTAIGVATPGSCVNSTPEENEGVNKVFKGANAKNVVFPFSVGKYIAQKFHSAACGKKPTKTQNAFGCNQIGNLVLRKVNGTAPTKGTGAGTVINASFAPAFQRIVYDVVPYATATKDHIPARLERFFASSHAKTKGWFCGTQARKILINYGFLPTVECGIGS